jgi:hypothetical protein
MWCHLTKFVINEQKGADWISLDGLLVWVKMKYRMRAIISRGLYFFYPFFIAVAPYTAERPLFLDSFFQVE